MTSQKPCIKNFLLLHAAIFILIHDISKVDVAEDLLKMFVSRSIQLYGQEFCTYNVHNLLHIADDVRKFGPLDNFSCFPFESFLGKIKKHVRSGAKPLQQVVRRICEVEAIEHVPEINDKSIFKYSHINGPLIPGNAECIQYQQLVTPSFTLKINNMSDSCCSIDNPICLVQNFIEYKKFKHKRNAYDYPINFEMLNITTVSDLSSKLL